MAYTTNPKNRGSSRFRAGSRISFAAALLAAGLCTVSHAQAQLASRHYLPPVAARGSAEIRLEISTPSTSDVAYTIRSKSGGLESGGASIEAITGAVRAGSPQQHDFERAGNNSDASGGLGYSTTATPTVLDEYGILIEASGPVTVTMYTLQGTNRDIVASKGDNALGTDFYLWSAANTPVTPNNVGVDNDSAHFFSIMAQQDGTVVDVTGASLFSNFTPGSQQLLLDAFQTVTVRTTQNTSITGTRLQSNKPIAVTSGDVHPSQLGRSERDGAIDQLVPTHLAGTQYVVGNIADSLAYGRLDLNGVGVGNRYVQIVALEANTQIDHYDSATDSSQAHTIATAGQPALIHLGGVQGTGHFFRSTNNKPFLMFLNSSGEPGGEMGGAALPALAGAASQGNFCSGTNFVEFTKPLDTTAFMVYIPTAQLSELGVDPGTGSVAYATLAHTVTAVDPDGPGGIESISFVRFPGSIVPDGGRVAFESAGRMHVAVGTAVASATGSFGYFSDYNTGFIIRDPVLQLPADSYQEPLSFADSRPRAIKHCLNIDSACSSQFRIADIESDRGGGFSNVSRTLGTDAPCFDFSPEPVPGGGPQTYTVAVTIQDDTGVERIINVVFTFTWAAGEELDSDGDGIPDSVERPGGIDRDTDGDGIPDHLDPDDDGDGIPTIDERPGGIDRDTDGDGIPDHLDPDDDGDGIPTIDERPGGIDRDTDGDGVPDHLDPDDDGDGIPTIDERPGGIDRDTDGDGIPDHLDPDDDGDGIPTIDERPGGKDRDTDGDGIPDHLDPDDDGDGIPTIDEHGDQNGNGIPDYLEFNLVAASLEGGGFGCSFEGAPTPSPAPWLLGAGGLMWVLGRRRRA